MKKEAGFVEVETMVLCRELHGGAWTCQPLADPSRVSFGDRDDALTRLERFLEKHLVAAPARVIARHGLPPGVELVDVDVDLVRFDMPKRLRRTLRVRFPCVLVPQGHDRWVMIPVLDHTFFVARGEKLDAVVASEVERLVAARGAWTYDSLTLLPAAEEELVPIAVLLAHEGEGLLGKARTLKKKKLAEHRRNRAVDVLSKVATPLHERRAGGGRIDKPYVGGEEPLAELETLLTAARRGGVLCVGEEGVGKSALIAALCARLREQRSGRMVFATSAAQLVAGMSGFGEWQERVTEVVLAAEELDAVLYFENLVELFGDRPERGGVDVAGVLRPHVVNGRVRVLGEISPDGLDGASRRQPALIAAMSQLRVSALDARATRPVLAEHVEAWRRAEGPTLSGETVSPIVELCDRYLPHRSFPGKAVRFAEDLRASMNDGETVGVEQVYEAFSVTSGIPGFLLRPEHALRVERVVGELKKRVVGQHEALSRIAETLSVVKARLQPEGKPLSTFLFIGPTGVGKTEVARAVAGLLFGGEERMVRFDMSEYSDPYAAERLIRGTEREGGVLTSRVREQPFSLLLLDEIEKAHPAVFDLLLSVLGEGRLSDARGRTTFFHNTIIILTSNLGADDDKAPIGLRARAPDRHERYLRAVHETFRSELVGRLDRVVVFDALTRDEIEAVTDLAIARIGDRRGLIEYGVALDVSADARRLIAAGGYDARYGVRALRRHLEATVVVPVARALARLGAEARGALVWVGTRDDGACPSENKRNRIARDAAGELVIELYRRAAAGGRRALAGIDAVAEVRRRTDALMDRDEVRGIVDHLELVRAQLATARSQRPGATRRQGLRGEDIELLGREQHRVERAVERVAALRGDVHAAEQLCLGALFDGERVEEWAAEASGLLGRLHGAIARLLLSPRLERDEVTVALFAPDGAGPLCAWLEPLIEEAARRAWTLAFHQRADGPHGEGWPAMRPFGPPRDVAWARANILGGRGLDHLVMRARGRDAGLWIALEGGMHRIFGFGDDDRARHLEVRLAAMRFELDDDAWAVEDLRRMPTSPRRGIAVARERHLRGADVTVHKARLARVPVADYWRHIEEIALEHLLFHYDSGSADSLWRGVCDVPAEAEEIES